MYAAEGDKQERLTSLIRVVEEFRKYDADMSLSQVLVYLLINNEPGLRVAKLLPLTGLSRSALSRNILSLSKGPYAADHRSPKKPGHDLITTVEDPFDGRAQMAAPTARGAELARRLGRIIRGEVPNGT